MIKQTNMPQVQRLNSNSNEYFLFVSRAEIPLVKGAGGLKKHATEQMRPPGCLF